MMSGYKPNNDSYYWPQWFNNIYITFCKTIYLFAIMMLLWTMLLGHFNWGKKTLTSTYLRSFGKFVFIAGLASPISITCFYMGLPYSIYTTGPNSNMFALGNITSSILVAFVVLIFVEYPLRTVIGYLTLPYIS
jgi:uncharacterized membrane protein